jgi:hypothetical protein
MKKRMTVGAGMAAVIAAAGFGGMAIAGVGDERMEGPREIAEPMVATEKGSAMRAGGATITTLYLNDTVDPPEDEGIVSGVSCPRRFGKAIGGGAATDEGIVVSYLSQIRPSNGNIAGRTYWIGVDDNSTTNGATADATIEVHCAKGLKVRK